MSCLLTALEKKVPLQSTCFKMLSERVQMWEYAAKVSDVLNNAIASK